jgi:parallel beta-helix repeat protein
MTRLAVAMLLGLLALVPPTHAAEVSCAAGDVACLITAIHTANATGGPQTILLMTGLYRLTTVDHDTDGPTGLPSITGTLTLRGEGPQHTVLERAAGAPPFRLLHVAATGVLTLEGLTLRGGERSDLPGGGIYTRGTLTLTDCTLSGHTASEGGGIYHSEDSRGPLTLTRSLVRDNVALGSGGGGGIRAVAPLTLTQSTLRGNMAHSSGGGISAVAPLTITHSTLHGNVAHGDGGGIHAFGFVDLSITNSTVSGNVAHGSGGGITLILSSTLRLTDSTLSGNTASQGGGLYLDQGGGKFAPSQAIVGNTILAGNTVPPTGIGPECVTASGTSPGQATSRGHTLLGDPRGCHMRLAASDLTGDPGLGDFSDDGTPGHGHVPLLPASPAIATGDPACPPTDQVGQPRVGACDIGAVEFQPPPDADVVTIAQAVFVEGLALLVVTATSSAAPAATLFVTVPGCWPHGMMALMGGRYVHLHADRACGALTGKPVVVTSSHGGVASALLR